MADDQTHRIQCPHLLDKGRNMIPTRAPALAGGHLVDRGRHEVYEVDAVCAQPLEPWALRLPCAPARDRLVKRRHHAPEQVVAPVERWRVEEPPLGGAGVGRRLTDE